MRSIQPPMQPGICLIHKPVGVTSFSIVRALMEEIAAAKTGHKLPVCHGGTLDPFAEGLLLILAGQATRLMEFLHAIPKCYVADIQWGAETDNGDPLGQVTHTANASGLTEQDFETQLQRFVGWHEQVPPATSAKKIDGEPAYKKAHRGEKFELPPSRVYLHEARWLSHHLPHRSRIFLMCRGGYYVRALARDLGRALGCRAHLTALRRTMIGPWEDPPPAERVWIQGTALIPWCSSRHLSLEEAVRLKQGQPIPVGNVVAPSWPLPQGFPEAPGPIRGLHQERLVALLKRDSEQLLTFANLRGGL